MTQRRQPSTVSRVRGACAALLFFVLAGSAFAEKESAAVPLKEKAAAAFEEHAYDAFYNDLTRIISEGDGEAEVFYYRALTRMEQIAHWRRTKNWQGVYDIGPTFQAGIAQDLAAAEEDAAEDAPVRFGIVFLRWRAAHDEGDAAAYTMFGDVVAQAEKTAASPEGLAFIKEKADEIRDLEDKNLSRQLHMVYLDHLADSEMSEEQIRRSADAFVEEGNLYLARSLYDILLERIEDDEARGRAMVEIAGRFAHPGDAEPLGPVYAEEIYAKARDLAGPAVFSQESLYRRAYNLERLKDYEAAVAAYKEWLAGDEAAQKEGSGPRRAEVLFRIAVLTAYGLGEAETAKSFLQDLIAEFPADPLVVSARYHLGLLAQWAEESDAAKEEYGAALAKAGEAGMGEDSEIAALTKARLEELQEEKPMAYGLRLFFEGTFGKKEKPASLHVDLTGRWPRSAPGKDVRYTVTTSNPMTGCMMPDYAYEWSNEVGGLENIPNTAELTTDYAEPGLKVAFVAVLGTAGLEGAAFDLVQVE